MNYIPSLLHIAIKVGISPMILLSVCTTETNLRNINNQSNTTYGICQLKLNTAKQYGGNFLDSLALQQTRVNIEVAAKYLKSLKSKYKSNDKTMAAYNLGHTQYMDCEFINQSYVNRCNKNLRHYKRKMCELNKNQIQTY
jgi:soluble lytic murein transglycosylase-like protein